jgi:hypothetical protein
VAGVSEATHLGEPSQSGTIPHDQRAAGRPAMMRIVKTIAKVGVKTSPIQDGHGERWLELAAWIGGARRNAAAAGDCPDPAPAKLQPCDTSGAAVMRAEIAINAELRRLVSTLQLALSLHSRGVRDFNDLKRRGSSVRRRRVSVRRFSRRGTAHRARSRDPRFPLSNVHGGHASGAIGRSPAIAAVDQRLPLRQTWAAPREVNLATIMS